MQIRITLLFLFFATFLTAGNPDRQGEAGAYELLLNPWARSIGLNAMNTAMVRGVESFSLNPAGLGRFTGKLETSFGNTLYMVGTDIKLNAFGLSQRVGKNGAIGLQVMTVGFGSIPVTTNDLPEGTGATFSPTFFNVAIGYAHTFENKVAVGILARGISETVSNLNASGFSLDAGVQYVSGDQDEFKIGIALRNVGSKMQFDGEGLAQQLPNPNKNLSYPLTYNIRPASFNMPSNLNIGMAYDFHLNTQNRATIIGNFTANSFSRDEIGAGAEYSFKEMFTVRGAYKYELGSFGNNSVIQNQVNTGLTAGVSFDVPFAKDSDTKLSIDYGYMNTRVWNGTHNITLRLTL
jgi:hypothetical protein